MIEKRYVLKKGIRRFINRVLILIIIVLIGMISIKINPDLKDKLKETIYENNFKIINNRKIYEKYFGNILTNHSSTKMVANEKIAYKKIEKYQNGARLLVEDNYLVPAIESGVVTYIKDKAIIINQVNGIEVCYKNISNTSLKLYDYVESGNTIGEVDGNKLYLEFKKDRKYLDYKKYL